MQGVNDEVAVEAAGAGGDVESNGELVAVPFSDGRLSIASLFHAAGGHMLQSWVTVRWGGRADELLHSF